MNQYQLPSGGADEGSKGLRYFIPFIRDEVWKMVVVLVIILLNSAINVISPLLLGYTIDQAIGKRDLGQLFFMVGILFILYFTGLVMNYFQVKRMGNLGQRVLLKLRKRLFYKIQELPMAFFNSNKIGDLISRVNNDTDKLNQFFSEALVRFAGSIFTILGIGVFMVILHLQLGLITLSSAIGLFVVTRFLSPWVKSRNRKSLDVVGQLSGEIQESLNNFKVIAAFGQGKYFYDQFEAFNERNFLAARWAGYANNILAPLYDLAGYVATLLVVITGLQLIATGNITVGLLVTFLSYSDKFYQPLRILASIWSSIQTSLAAWARVNQILQLKNNLKVEEPVDPFRTKNLLEMMDVSFGYKDDHMVLKHLNLEFKPGKTYAVIGPTGGGKSTLASLISRLYDPQEGDIYFEGRSLKSYSREELSEKIGFILQEPNIFSGTILQNILYGNRELEHFRHEDLLKKLREMKLDTLLERFNGGLEMPIVAGKDAMSLGQKQLIAFLRIVLRQPKLLIMDEATANIDTVTEKILQDIIENLPADTTKIVIAHRLNTIKSADEIIFISEGRTQKAMSFEAAMGLIQKNSLKS